MSKITYCTNCCGLLVLSGTPVERNKGTVYTVHIRATRRNKRTHHDMQAYIAVGTICVKCGYSTYNELTLKEQLLRIQKRGQLDT